MGTKITFKDRLPMPGSVHVGMGGEHNAETIYLDGLPVFDSTQVTLLNLVIGDTVDAIDIIDDAVTLTRNHTLPGTMIAWVTIQVGTELVWKSEKMYLTINDLPDISDPIEQQYPTAFEQIIAQTGDNVTAAQAAQTAAELAQGKAEDAQTAAETAQTAAETAQGKAEDAQTAAETAQGKAETAQGKAEDAQSGSEGARDGAQRAAGLAEAAKEVILGMRAEAVTLPAGDDATASYSEGVMTFGIPKGDKGNVNFAAMVLDPVTGILTMYYSQEMDYSFQINSEGYLEVVI